MTKRLLASLMLIGLISLTGCAKTEETPVVEGEEATTEEAMEDKADGEAMEGEAMEDKADGEAMEGEAMEDKAEGEAMEDKAEEAAA